MNRPVNRTDLTVHDDEMTTPFALIDRVWGDWFGRRAAPSAGMIRPAVDVSEDEHSYTFSFELPGLRKEDVKITVEDGVLTVSGERRFEEEKKDKTFHRIERSYGAFHRALNLPSAVDVNKADVTFNDGVLQVMLPKTEEAKPRTLKIK